jgi:phosphate-selective porin OprO/OprP
MVRGLFAVLAVFGLVDVNPAMADDSSGFVLKNEKSGNELVLQGFFQADSRSYIASGSQDTKDLFLIRRARPYLYGTLQKDFEYRLMADFGNGTTVLQDAFVGYRASENSVQLRAGKFKQPVSYEEFSQEDRGLVVFERSMIDQLVPGRVPGLMVFGEGLFDRRFDYYLSVSNGNANSDIEEPRPQKDLNGRVAFHPAEAYHLTVGVSGSVGSQQGAVTPLILTTPMKVQWVQFNSNTQGSGTRYRIDPEISIFSGPFGFAAQYLYQHSELSRADKGPSSATDVMYSGYYLMTTWLLSGEARTSYARIHPDHKLGAFEAVFQLTGMNIGDTGSLVDTTKNATQATSGTVGLNWYVNDWVWVQTHLEHSWFGTPVQLSPVGDFIHESTAWGLRFAVLF